MVGHVALVALDGHAEGLDSRVVVAVRVVDDAEVEEVEGGGRLQVECVVQMMLGLAVQAKVAAGTGDSAVVVGEEETLRVGDVGAVLREVGLGHGAGGGRGVEGVVAVDAEGGGGIDGGGGVEEVGGGGGEGGGGGVVGVGAGAGGDDGADGLGGAVGEGGGGFFVSSRNLWESTVDGRGGGGPRRRRRGRRGRRSAPCRTHRRRTTRSQSGRMDGSRRWRLTAAAHRDTREEADS